MRKELGGQKYFWELFSFAHIPVEVISRLYQRFVTGHGAVYTPQFLAALLLDQVMPYERMTGKEKVLDPPAAQYLSRRSLQAAGHSLAEPAWLAEAECR